MRINGANQRAVCVLTEYLGSVDWRHARIRRLSAGGQADIFLFRRRSELLASCIGPGDLVVKLYRRAPELDRMIREEFESLRCLRALVHGMTADQWSIASPAPLHHSVQQKAIIMEPAPGRPLPILMSGREENPERWESIGKALLAALTRYWRESERIFGDLNFNNLLCDLSRRSIALIDAGMPAALWQCSDSPRDGYPATRDLAYLLYWTASSVRSTLGNRRLRRRQQWLAERVLANYLDRCGTGASRHQIVEEIRRCAEAHLDALQTSRTPSGLWRTYVQRRAAHTIESVLERLVSRSDEPAHAVDGARQEVVAP